MEIKPLMHKRGADFIRHAYLMLLGRPVDAEGMAHYLNRLRAGHHKGDILLDIFDSKECEIAPNASPELNIIIQEARHKRGFFHKILTFYGLRTKNALIGIEFQIEELSEEIKRINVITPKKQEHKTMDSTHLINDNLDTDYINAIDSFDLLTPVAKSPIFSIIILQYNKAELTLNCINSILRYTDMSKVEVIVVDNGSKDGQIEMLERRFRHSVRFVKVGLNRYFGEGNNIGVDFARGDILILMNNDIAVVSNWLEKLNKIELMPFDAAGPAFLYPTGTVQECGAYLQENGESFQQFRGADISQIPDTIFRCDYISAALIMMHKEAFVKVGGFDLCFEPAYYEDADLCLKLKSYGGNVYCNPNLLIYHNENATSADPSHGLSLTSNVVSVNKTKFLDRWGRYLSARDSCSIEEQKVPGAKALPIPTYNSSDRIWGSLNCRPKAMLYTPFSLIPGGGEKYFLSIAEYLAVEHDVYLVLPYLYSYTRLRQMGASLNLTLSALNIITLSEANEMSWDLTVVIGNSIAPPFPKKSPNSVYICQFPFDKKLHSNSPVENAGMYKYVCYSNFVRNNILENKSIKPSSVVVVPPYVDFYPRLFKEKIILSVGRFFVGDHSKNQLFIIDTFKKFVSNECFKDWKLVLIGSTRPEFEHRSYYKKCIDSSLGFNVEIIPDASVERLSHYYSISSIYWHGSGFGIDSKIHPEKSEHFGITPLEACSAGCFVIVPNQGGPYEIASMAPDGFYSYESQDDLLGKTKYLAGLDDISSDTLRNLLSNFSKEFRKDVFHTKLNNLIDSSFYDSLVKAGDEVCFKDLRVSWRGWHHPEEVGRWSDGYTSHIEFNFPDEISLVSSIKVTLSVFGFQGIGILLNEKLVVSKIISGDATFHLPGPMLRNGFNRISFSLPDARQVSRLDTRIISVFLKNISFLKDFT